MVKFSSRPPMLLYVSQAIAPEPGAGRSAHRGYEMTKSDLIVQIALDKGISKARAELAVNMIFDCLTQAMLRNERVEIRGLGSFEMRNYGSYKGRNPRTGDSVAVRPKRLPFFKAGKEIKDIINDLQRTREHSAVDMAMEIAATAKAG